jgi:transposase
MTVQAELAAEIRRLYFAEHWPVGTISKQLSVHADVVRRVVGLFSTQRVVPPPVPRLCAPYVDFIAETLARYPKLRATRLFEMIKERGYPGSIRTLREHVAAVRPVPKREAFLRVESLIGEQAQVDWAHVGKVKGEGGQRSLWAFVLVLSWSRAMWAELVFDLTAHSLCRSLVRAAQALGGCPRQWLFDNPKTVVLERHGDAVRFHPALVALASKLHVQPRLCAVRRPQHKGKVERSIRSLRDGFFDGRIINDLEQGNRDLTEFIERVMQRRQHPRISGRSVGECFAEEKERLLPLPQPPPITDLVLPVRADKTAFVRFDCNHYSVPWLLAEKPLTLVADDIEVRFIDDDEEVASHRRRWGKGEFIEEHAHRQGLVEHRRAAGESKGRDLLSSIAKGFDALCARWVEAGRNVGNMTARAVKLLDLYGAESFSAAVDELLARGTHDIGALAHVCEQRRRARALPVPVEVTLPAHVNDHDVVPHSLGSYDDDDF